MSNPKYKKQVGLLLRILPCVSKEKCFALYGDTAINLFIHNMPRLSVDIDLTYLPIKSRQITLKNISGALERIKNCIEDILPNVRVLCKPDVGRLVIRADGEEIKLEVNLVMRGTLSTPENRILCDQAQETYDMSLAMQVVPLGQLYGGKICAALDRQHPRDLFDVKILMENEGFSDVIREGFLLCLLCNDRPINEVLVPNFQNQRQAMDNQFAGMSDIEFTYEDFEETREQLVETVSKNLTDKDKAFLLSIKNCDPDWSIYDFARFPAVQWKLYNLRKLKEDNPDKHNRLYQVLQERLEG